MYSLVLETAGCLIYLAKYRAIFHIGIAVGSGTDVAMESAQIVLIKDDLRDVVSSIELSKRTMGKVKQGLFGPYLIAPAAYTVNDIYLCSVFVLIIGLAEWLGSWRRRNRRFWLG